MDRPKPDFQKFWKILKPEAVLIQAQAYTVHTCQKMELNSRWTVLYSKPTKNLNILSILMMC
jgi:hypothetical protein